MAQPGLGTGATIVIIHAIKTMQGSGHHIIELAQIARSQHAGAIKGGRVALPFLQTAGFQTVEKHAGVNPIESACQPVTGRCQDRGRHHWANTRDSHEPACSIILVGVGLDQLCAQRFHVEARGLHLAFVEAGRVVDLGREGRHHADAVLVLGAAVVLGERRQRPTGQEEGLVGHVRQAPPEERGVALLPLRHEVAHRLGFGPGVGPHLGFTIVRAHPERHDPDGREPREPIEDAEHRVVEHRAVVYRRTFRASLFSSFLNPVLYLAAMGMGLGMFVDKGGGRATLAACRDSLADSAKSALTVGMACAIVGTIIGMMTQTGVGTIFGGWVIGLGEKSLFLALVMTMLLSILLGTGIPTIPTYIITAALAAPALAKLGVPLGMNDRSASRARKQEEARAQGQAGASQSIVDDDIPGPSDPLEHLRVVELELALADLESVETKLGKMQKAARMDKSIADEVAALVVVNPPGEFNDRRIAPSADDEAQVKAAMKKLKGAKEMRVTSPSGNSASSSSRRSFAGNCALPFTISGTDAMVATGARSRCGSNGNLYRCGFTPIGPMLPMIIV